MENEQRLNILGYHLESLTEAIAAQITEDDDKVWVYIGVGYVLDQDGLHEAIKKALKAF